MYYCYGMDAKNRSDVWASVSVKIVGTSMPIITFMVAPRSEWTKIHHPGTENFGYYCYYMPPGYEIIVTDKSDIEFECSNPAVELTFWWEDRTN